MLTLQSLITERELETVSLIAKGLTNQAIADIMFIQRGTVENHIGSIVRKVFISNNPNIHPRITLAIMYLKEIGCLLDQPQNIVFIDLRLKFIDNNFINHEVLKR